ncbi:BREX-3 system P-loop-containing protein BrxF [Desulfofundulus thermocisternus]|uniref:BREX-3 system P-loop-containing protein BrxF n=1 Tax=Desulfofundulus thermocisternus TaxID=42471 RepID=UPI00217CFD64|nr:BREX-3 system P-loop-containing protein BrxF [Desulfofundulus thermocisternus]MCS5694999.1 BREX-3 system P-loop-containing protein BrxF [Desulfofundulus thermocisternus]
MSDKIEDLKRYIEAARSRYYQLVLLVGPAATGKTLALLQLSNEAGYSYINLNLILSQKLLEYPGRVRPLRLPRIVEAIIDTAGDTVLLDNIEILFEPALQQDPLRLLQHISRTRIIVAAWSGKFEGRTLIYAEPGHPEYRKYSEVDALVCQI